MGFPSAGMTRSYVGSRFMSLVLGLVSLRCLPNHLAGDEERVQGWTVRERD